MQKQIKPLTIGIIGGGQLGRMSAHSAQSLGHKVVIFSDQAQSPANLVSDVSIIAHYNNVEAIEEFATMIDIATFEFENIPIDCIEHLSGIRPVYPSAHVLRITQNRIFEKNFLNGIDIATADFAAIKTLEDLQKNCERFGKSVLKTATMGYDGKGQFVLENKGQAVDVWKQIAGNSELILEKFCPFTSEISVMVARSHSGEISCFAPLTNIHKNGILDKSIYPAQISEECKNNAQEIATKIAQKLDLIGVLAVEFFVMPGDKSGDKLLVNELAPRPHNSGHFSMNAAHTSQFEQLIRAITDMPLGDATFHSQGYMKNLIGDEVDNLEEFIANKKAKIHLYGKKEALKGRKMGHVNVLEKNCDAEKLK